jgi:DNA-binding transcriptional LysR family regulator
MTHSYSDLPSLDGLLAVLAAAETGSLTFAAEQLGVTHGAISRRVRAVEIWLGAPVFERHGRGVRPTPAGQRFTRQVRQTLEALGQTSERWRPRHRKTTVRLSVVPSFAKLWLLPRLSTILEQLPPVRVDLTVEHRTADLDSGEADVVVRYGRGNWSGVQSRHLFSETLLPVGSPDLAAQLGPNPSPEALSRLPMIHDSDTSQWRAWYRDVGVRYTPGLEDRRFEDYDLVLAAAEGSLGLALLRLPIAREWLERRRLVPVSAVAPANSAAHFVASRRGEERPGVLRLVDQLCSAALAFEQRCGG